MHFFRGFRKYNPLKAQDEPVLGWALHPSGRVDAIKQGSGLYGGGTGEGAFTETALGAQLPLSQSTFGWSAAYSVSTWVYGCIEAHKKGVHRMPWQILNRRSRQPIENHPLEIAIRRNRQKLFKKIVQSYWLYGEVFIELATNDYGFRSDLYWLNNNGMAVLVGMGRITGYSYTAMQGGQPRNFEVDDIAFMHTDNPFNDLRGMSPTEVILDEVAIDKDVARVVRAYYANDTRTGILLIPKTPMLPVDRDRFIDFWKAQLQGPNKAGKPVILPQDMSVERVQEPASLDDAQLRESVRRDICAAYGVPLSLAGGWDDAKYQSLPEQRKSFYEETIIPECEGIAEFINRDIMPFFDDSGVAEFKYDFTEILALTDDAQRKNDIYSNRLVSGVITRAEARKALGHPVRDIDDVYYIPAGITIVPADELTLVTPQTNQVSDGIENEGLSPGSQDVAVPRRPGLPPPPPRRPEPPALPEYEQPKALASGRAVPVPQKSAEDELNAWEKKALNHGAQKATRFVCYVLPPETQNFVREALRSAGRGATKAAIRAVFAIAREATKKGPPTAPEMTLDYWRHYDDLMAEIGTAWLEDYMAQALDSLLPVAGTGIAEADIQAALDSGHSDFLAALLGTEDAPGPLVKLILAGMGAGQEALAHGRAANPQRPVSAKAVLDIDWGLLAREAFSFARQYAFDLIRRVDDTTRQTVSAVVSDWIQSGASLDDLKARLEKIFKDPVRAQRIAQTEATRSYAEGSRERYRQADVKLVRWNTVSDGSVCPICQRLDGTTAPVDSGWQTDDGYVLPPAHPSCRCWVRPVVGEV